MAIRGSSVVSRRSSGSGKAATTASRRSPTPLPGADGHWLAEAQLPKLICLPLLRCTVHLVHCNDDRDFGCPQDGDHPRVVVTEHGGPVDDQDHDIGTRDGPFGLLADRPVQVTVGLHLPASRIDEDEVLPCPVGVELSPVPGYTRLLLDDGRARPDDPIDQGRLPDIGPANHRHDGQSAHRCSGVESEVVGQGTSQALIRSSASVAVHSLSRSSQDSPPGRAVTPASTRVWSVVTKDLN